ncbi:response regulator transcription factor [Panacibacter sp. DH6]|uniref:Response regulator transcription factor n=1 Tax=Panacibacter microcysteis TaxID=2793269 RepID=A0A931GUV5_9BACT|nr:LytTR family DNA-binding domain-containing protein [Panacibacter microcysteis]MBG9377096.1 response regulator transcription factor [Panacibacter microcysteis]
MIKCIAVDDEPLALSLLEDYISKISFLQLVAKCSDAFEAQKALQQHDVDLIFIDIQMPGLTGLQFIQSLTSRPMVILVTAYEKFALEGFNLNVVDYVLKPVELSRFMQACNKANELYELKNQQKNNTTPAAGYFFVNVDYSLLKVMFNDIIWIEGLRDYVKLHLKSSSKPLMIRMTLKAVEDELPPANFIRIHRSFVVAVDSITSIRKSSVFIGDIELPVGDTYKEVINQLTGKNSL